MSSNFLADIAEDYKQLYETRENYDVIICAGEKPNAEEIHAHSLVLRTRSAYFRGALASSWAAKDKDSGCFIFNKPNISPSVFEFILKYLYCGEIILQNQDRETILELLVASDEFGLTKLIDYVQQYFGENIKAHLSQNPIDILHLDDVTEFNQDDFELLEKTLQKCIQYIRFHEIKMPDFYHKVLPYMPILPRRISSSYYSYAMYCHNSHGPNFGNGDLHFNGNYVYLNGNGYYPNIGISNGLQIEDYEVFQ
ncbi:14472_t:CDS:2, partial [Gigaspora margarita]